MRKKFTSRVVIIVACLFCCGIIGGCSSAPETDTERQARWAQGNLTEWEMENGIGPIAADIQLGAIDAVAAEQGKQVYVQKCASCHYLDMRKTGPGLRDVTKRRSAAYVLNQMQNPETMGKVHPEGKKLVAQYAQFMTIQGITPEMARQILEFLRSEADKPAVAAEQQPGFGVPAPPATGK